MKRLGEKKNVEGMARFGIRAKKVFGVSKPKLDELAKRIGKNHELGMEIVAARGFTTRGFWAF